MGSNSLTSAQMGNAALHPQQEAHTFFLHSIKAPLALLYVSSPLIQAVVGCLCPSPLPGGRRDLWKDLQYDGATMQWWKSTVFQMWSECRVEDGHRFPHLLAVLLLTQPGVLLAFIGGLGSPSSSPGPQALLRRAAPHPGTLQGISLSQTPFALG